MSTRTPVDSHFVQKAEIDVLGHRPHKTAKLLFQALTATAVFRIWPTLLFMGAWSAMIVLVNMKTSANMVVPSTMLTVLGVLLGLTLSYRTSSAYMSYSEGRKLWSQIILANRSWARIVWIHCPDSLVVTPPENPQELEIDAVRAILEKSTMVRLGLAFSTAVKHYLRGEEGILYEDLYDLVKFIPSLNLPSGLPDPAEAINAAGNLHLRQTLYSRSAESLNESIEMTSKLVNNSSFTSRQVRVRPVLQPARNPPKFRWSETFPFSYFTSRHQRDKAKGRKALRQRMKQRSGGGIGQNVPLEVIMFMSSWIATMQSRKTIDVPTINSLMAALQSMSDALASLEKILTTPIPWSYNAHIWEVTWIYCLVLPFQLYNAGFGWITIPAVVITSYIVIGFAEIGEEIENPFGYDKNDLNLDFFVDSIIKQELAAITARPFPPTDDWIFSGLNDVHGRVGVGADSMLNLGVEDIRRSLAMMSGGTAWEERKARTPSEYMEVLS